MLTGGLAAGALLLSALGGAPMLVALPVHQYVHVHKFLVTRFDPFMPLCLLAALLADAAITGLTTDARVRALAVAGALLYAGVITVSLTKNVPINRWIAALDPSDLPADWRSVDPRARWRSWNTVRTCLAVTALVINVAMVGVLL
ncbi:DUF1772 domain-containing protein [Nonomuraea glycinis]|uniref:DUF1772 domain-containing protein n=1 Tax=Nonomuraea glycinis TaxID=2047744 RepID=UPI0033A885E0